MIRINETNPMHFNAKNKKTIIVKDNQNQEKNKKDEDKPKKKFQDILEIKMKKEDD